MDGCRRTARRYAATRSQRLSDLVFPVAMIASVLVIMVPLPSRP